MEDWPQQVKLYKAIARGDVAELKAALEIADVNGDHVDSRLCGKEEAFFFWCLFCIVDVFGCFCFFGDFTSF